MKLSPLLPLTLAATFPAMALPMMTLDQQFDTMEKAARGALDTRQFTLDGVVVTAWLDGDMPVIIAVPRLDEKGQEQGVNRYYFKGGVLFGVREPESRFQFEQGKLTAWLDEEGQPQPFVSQVSLAQREQWLLKRAAQLRGLFTPSRGEQLLDRQDPSVKVTGTDRTQWLCHDKLVTLTGGEKVIFDAGKVQASEQGVKGRVSLLKGDDWQDLDMQCHVRGYRVVSLIWRAPKRS